MRADIVVPIAAVVTMAALVVAGVVDIGPGRLVLWGATALVGTVFLIRYSAASRWWRSAKRAPAHLRTYQREIVIWSGLITASAWLALLVGIYGDTWPARPWIGFAIASATLLAMSRRFSLFVRSQRDAEGDHDD